MLWFVLCYEIMIFLVFLLYWRIIGKARDRNLLRTPEEDLGQLADASLTGSLGVGSIATVVIALIFAVLTIGQIGHEIAMGVIGVAWMGILSVGFFVVAAIFDHNVRYFQAPSRDTRLRIKRDSLKMGVFFFMLGLFLFLSSTLLLLILTMMLIGVDTISMIVLIVFHISLGGLMFLVFARNVLRTQTRAGKEDLADSNERAESQRST